MSRNREWFAPPGGDGGAVLQFYNSLVDEKVPFIPAAGAGSKQITWYACGPTVYDSAHMGHARNYVTFDVIRRVLEDYFGYNVLYVMNVTDVDDKIILRARRNHLLQRYKEQETDASKVGGCKLSRHIRQLAGQRLRQLALLQQWNTDGLLVVNRAH
jgi:cysteinyl-tRNA synthetase